ncbi:hypothetical protein CJT70_33520, partial [Pseudomonas aeruginosa]
LRRQGHRSPPARLPPGRTQAEPDLPGTDHHRQRGAVAGDARRRGWCRPRRGSHRRSGRYRRPWSTAGRPPPSPWGCPWHGR